MKQLNILDLHRSMNERKNRVTESYEKVLDICHKKIQNHALQQLSRCLIDVPCYVAGYPLFDYSKCIEFVYDNLKKNGFFVKYYFPKHIYVSWDFQEINESKKKHDIDKKQIDNNNKHASLSYKPSGKLQLNID